MTDKPPLIVTGLSGLVGSCLAPAIGKWFELVPFDLESKCDILNLDSLRKKLAEHPNANVLAHLAAYTDVSRAYAQTNDKSGPCHRLNVVGTENVVKACAERGIHVIFVSTDFVFDGSKPAKQGAYVETDPPRPIEWYGRTKFMAEEVVRKSPAWTIIRIAYPYVSGDAPRSDLVRNIYAKLVEGLEVSLFTDQVITPTFGADIAKGIGLLARMRPKGETYHLVGSSPTTPFDLGLKIARAFNFDQRLVRPGTLAEYLKKDPRPRHPRLHLSNAKWTALALRHGLHQPLTLDEGLARVVRDQPSPTKSDLSKTE